MKKSIIKNDQNSSRLPVCCLATRIQLAGSGCASNQGLQSRLRKAGAFSKRSLALISAVEGVFQPRCLRGKKGCCIPENVRILLEDTGQAKCHMECPHATRNIDNTPIDILKCYTNQPKFGDYFEDNLAFPELPTEEAKEAWANSLFRRCFQAETD